MHRFLRMWQFLAAVFLFFGCTMNPTPLKSNVDYSSNNIAIDHVEHRYRSSQEKNGEKTNRIIDVRVPLLFVENKGQLDESVRFHNIGKSPSIWFNDREVTVVVCKEETTSIGHSLAQHRNTLKSACSLVTLSVSGAHMGLTVRGEDQRATKVSMLHGSDSTYWKRDLTAFGSVVYHNIHPGVDLKFHGDNQELEYDLILDAGVDPSTIIMRYDGITGLSILENGDLRVEVRKGQSVINRKPRVYQDINGKQVELEGFFQLSKRLADDEFYTEESGPSIADAKPKEHLFTFAVKGNNPSYPLVIDPIFLFSGCVGGTDSGGPDDGIYRNSTAVDQEGNIYIAGSAYFGVDPPELANAYQPINAGLYDAYLVKLNPTGTAIIYATFLGGGSWDSAKDLSVDGEGNAYITGVTQSADFPVSETAFQKKIKAILKSIFIVPYVNGLPLLPDNFWEAGGLGYGAMEVLPDGRAVMQIIALGEEIINQMKADPTYEWVEDVAETPDSEAFVVKLNPEGNGLVYSSYLGGIDRDIGTSIQIDNSGNAYVAGYTGSSDFPTTSGALQRNRGTAFVTKVAPLGESLVYSTRLGGGCHDTATCVAVDTQGNAFVTGTTCSDDFPTTEGAYKRVKGIQNDAFVSKISAAGDRLIYSTFLGGSDWEDAYGIALDSLGNAYVTGQTVSTDFPTTENALQPYRGGPSYNGDAFLVKLDPSGASLIFSTYLGGSEWDVGNAVSIDPTGNAYVTGTTWSSDFPLTPDAHKTFYSYNPSSHNSDAFFSVISPLGDTLIYSTYLGGPGYDTGNDLQVDSCMNVIVTGGSTNGFPVTDGTFGAGYAGLFFVKFAASEDPLQDTDGDGTPDCLDGCPADESKTNPGVCGCGVADDDSDKDGVMDCIDNCPTIANPAQKDSDGDKIGDACEGARAIPGIISLLLYD